MPHLVLVALERTGPPGVAPAALHLTKFPCVVGRGPDCELRLYDPMVSRRHCRFDWRGAGKFPTWSPLRFTTLTMIGGAAVTIAITVLADLFGVAHLPSLATLGTVTPHLLYIALVGSVAAVLLWTVAVRNLGPSTAVLFMNLAPILALVIATVGGAPVTGIVSVANVVPGQVVPGGQQRPQPQQ